MARCSAHNITIHKGSTFIKTLRWEVAPLISVPITGASQAAPVVITAAAHGVPDGWRVAIVGIPSGSMFELNASAYPPKAADFKKATVLTANTLELNEVSSAEYTTWTSGGFLVYYSPVDLAGFTARMQIRRSVTSTEVEASLTTENGGITLDNVDKTIVITMAAAETEDLDFASGVYDIEMISGTGVVTNLLSGSVVVASEVTR